MQSTKTKPSLPRFKVGELVAFRYGVRKVPAHVIEDRGSLGINRRRLYRVRLDQPPEEPVTFEVPEDDLGMVPPTAAAMEYLKQGGLIAILRTGVGGPHAPRVWLTLNSHGEVVHTFLEEQGIVGGNPAPPQTLQGDKVFTPRKPQVIEYLTTFGLNPDQAEDVIRTVGTAP